MIYRQYFDTRRGPDLLVRAARRGVGDRPRRFFARFEFGFSQNVNKHWENVRIDHVLQNIDHKQ